MPFDAAVPLNSDSPAIFPAQNQTNMSRLQTIISADHQFNLSAAANDGYHNLIHLTQQAPSGALAATGRVYAKSTGGLVQLFYMDDAGTEYQITPDYVNSPIKVSGSASIAAGASQTILSVAYDFTGFGVALIDGTSVQRTYNFNRSGAATDINELDSNAGVVSRPTLQFSGTDLTVKNNSGSAQTVVWSLMINRL
jgi:hypothetical protein